MSASAYQAALDAVALVRLGSGGLERLRRAGILALVVDASSGLREATPAGWGTELHRGPVVAVCSLRDVQQWLGEAAWSEPARLPALASRLREAARLPVCIGGAAAAEGRSLAWLDTHHARGWLGSPAGRETAGSELFARHLGAAMMRGFVAADAAVIAMMGSLAGQPDRADFLLEPRLLPQLSWGEAPRFAAAPAAAAGRPLGLYAIIDDAERLRQVLAAGVQTVQLRIKKPPAPDAGWHAMLRREVGQSIAACRAAGAELFVNDHWQLAVEFGAHGVHLGQEDLVGLGHAGREALLASGLALGVSSHSLWELARARALAPRYIACGPVWPTKTKDMPWLPQGLDNLAWWCRMAQAPVVAIGGVLGPAQVMQAARCGADGVCIVRGLGDRPGATVPSLQAALAGGRREHEREPMPPAWPHPSLPEHG